MFRIASVALIALAFLSTTAMAADTTVDLTGVFAPAAEVVLAVVGVFALWFARKGIDALQERLGLDLDDQLKARIDDALFNAIQFGKAKVLARAKDTQITFDVRNEVLRHAITYAKAAVPEALDYFDIDQTRLHDLLEARLGLDLNNDGFIGGAPS